MVALAALPLGLVKQLLPVFGGTLMVALPDGGGKLFLDDSLVTISSSVDLDVSLEEQPATVDLHQLVRVLAHHRNAALSFLGGGNDLKETVRGRGVAVHANQDVRQEMPQ